MTQWKIEYWVIPPDADGEFVANMEESLCLEASKNRTMEQPQSAQRYA